MKPLLLILAFFTRLPIGHLVSYSEDRYLKSIKFFPLVGLLIGSFLLIPAILLEDYTDLRSLSILFIYLWISGGIHLDGLADSADGLFSGRPKNRILEIMKDPHIGSFGVIALILYFLSFFVLTKSVKPLGILWMPFVGKSMGFLSASISEYAREDQGMGYVFIKNITKKQAIPLGAGLLILSFFTLGLEGIIAVFATCLFSYVVTKNIHKHISGMTGDTIGLIIETSQLFFLLSLTLLGLLI